MNEFKEGDILRRLADPANMIPVGTLCEVESVDFGLVFITGFHGGFIASNFELESPKYPNPPHKHADVIIEWAKGADILFDIGGSWIKTDNPKWQVIANYKVAPTLSELADIKTQAKIAKLEAKLAKLRSEL